MGFNSISSCYCTPPATGRLYCKSNAPTTHVILRHMEKLIRPAIILALTIFLALSCAMIAFSTKPPSLKNATGAALFMQTTPTPPIEADRSEVGSTDEIVVMGGVIAVIVLLPLLLQRKAWMKKDQA